MNREYRLWQMSAVLQSLTALPCVIAMECAPTEAPAISTYVGFALIFAGIVISEYLPLRAEKRAAKQSGAKAEAIAPDCKQAETRAIDPDTLEEADAFMR